MPAISGRGPRAARTLAAAARAAASEERVMRRARRSRSSSGQELHLELLEHHRHRAREGEPLAVAPALIAAREEEAGGLGAEGREHERPAVSALAEGLRRSPLDLELPVEAQVALVVAHDEVVELEGGDTAAGVAGGAAELLHEVELLDG